MFKVHARRIVVFIVAGLIVALFYGSTVPKQYESQAQLLLDQMDSSRLVAFSEEVARMLSLGYNTGLNTELHILQSEPLFAQAALRVADQYPQYRLSRQQIKELYQLYKVGGAHNSRLVQIVARAHNPEHAALLANEIFSVYNELRERNSINAIRTSLQWLREEVAVARQNLENAESRIRKFKEENGIITVESEASEVGAYAAALSRQRDEAQTSIRTLQAEIAGLRRKLAMLPVYDRQAYSQEKTPLVTTLEARVAQLQADRLALLKNYREDSKTVRDFDQQIAAATARLTQERQSQWQENSQSFQKDPIRSTMEGQLAANEVLLASMQAKLSSANNLLGQQDQLIKQLPKRDKDMSQLVRTRAQTEARYNYLQQQLDDLEVKERAKVGSAQIMAAAVAEPEPVAPDIAKMGIFGAIAGACLGVLFSFLFESLRLPVRSSSQLTELTGLPVAATVPLLPRRRANKMLSSLPSPDAKPSESFRFMAFSQLAREGGAPKIVMFTGIGGSVGCSSAAGQFALATAQTGVRTLLVDCDLRHPAITDAFEFHDKSGLSDMLNRTMLASDSADLTIETAHENLKVVPAGTDSGQGGGLAEYPTSHIVGIIENMKERADVIVLDAPPCDVVSDASRLVPYVDQVCLVISAASTSFRSVPIAYELLRRAGAKEINMILTHSSPQDEPFTKRSRYLVTNR
ncbi:MAG TPA: AAA family ATPase [Fimbriimonadaceae bacterium]|nr:AAA family ATPase [Fimbriimonadaceae bacterium]